jgi:nucleotide-binding universal stress UspA family protein
MGDDIMNGHPIALVCVRGYRVAALLDAARAVLAPHFAWIILHVVDVGPLSEVKRALGSLPGRGRGQHHAAIAMHQAAAELEQRVQQDVNAWLAARGSTAELLVRRGQPEREILAVANERSVEVIVLGSDYSGPEPLPLSPPVRHLIDHARCDVLLLRRYALEAAPAQNA